MEAAIEQAFEHASTPFIGELGLLAAEMAYRQEEDGHLMAARQYLQCAAQLAMGDQQAGKESVQAVMAALMEFDRRKPFPFPLRNPYHLRIPAGPVAQDPEFKQAIQTALRFAWRSAAASFTQLAEKHRSDVDLWYNAALCRLGRETTSREPSYFAAPQSWRRILTPR